MNIVLPEEKKEKIGIRIRQRRLDLGYTTRADFVDAIDEYVRQEESKRIREKYSDEIETYVQEHEPKGGYSDQREKEAMVQSYIDKKGYSLYKANVMARATAKKDGKKLPDLYREGKPFALDEHYLSSPAIENIERGRQGAIHESNFNVLLNVLQCDKEYLLLEINEPYRSNLGDYINAYFKDQGQTMSEASFIYEVINWCRLSEDFSVIHYYDSKAKQNYDRKRKVGIKILREDKEFYISEEFISNMAKELSHYTELLISHYSSDHIEGTLE